MYQNEFRQLQIRIARLESLYGRTASVRTAAGKAYLLAEGLTAAKVRAGEGAMLYMIDPGTNKSKYYEMLVKPKDRGLGYMLIKRWGRLGPRFQQNIEEYGSLEVAKIALARTLASKTAKGYISTYGDYHRNSAGAKLPIGQYPVGLETNPGTWANQQVVSCKPVLRQLLAQLVKSVRQVESGSVGATLLRSLEAAYATTSDLEESMAQIVRAKLRAPINRIKGEGRHIPDPAKISKELRSLHKYLELQLSIVP